MTEPTLTTLIPRLDSPVLIGYTNRRHGASKGVFGTNNLSANVGDAPHSVARNRSQLQSALGEVSICWLNQVHGSSVVRANPKIVPQADAMWTDESDVALAILTADCVPVMLHSEDGNIIAAAHSGWRGLARGVIESLIAMIEPKSSSLRAWLGPAICRHCYEVREDVLNALGITSDSKFVNRSKQPGRYLLDLPSFVGERLVNLGVKEVARSDICTCCNEDFYSYRRDGTTGRSASLILRRGKR